MQDLIKNILKYIGEDINREGLLETPKRVEKAFDELFCGYKIDDKTLYKLFKTNNNNNMVISKDISFTSFCEHHMLPFHGTITIAYIPNNFIIGLSKLARIVDCFSKRLQIQENLVENIAESIDLNLKPLGVLVIAKANHQCIACRGVKKENISAITISKKGAFNEKENLDLFFNMIK